MANTTADKLAKLQDTKADIKAALAEKGQIVGDVFSTYGDAVRAIETGGANTAVLQINPWNPGTKYLSCVDKNGEYKEYSYDSMSSDEISIEINVPCLAYVYSTRADSSGEIERKKSFTDFSENRVSYVLYITGNATIQY